jgi:hypothetical protein
MAGWKRAASLPTRRPKELLSEWLAFILFRECRDRCGTMLAALCPALFM